MVLSNLLDTAVLSDALPVAPSGAKVGKVRGLYLRPVGMDTSRAVEPALLVQTAEARYVVLGLDEVRHTDREVWARRAEVPEPEPATTVN